MNAPLVTDDSERRSLHTLLAQLTRNIASRTAGSFPGSQPISLEKRHLNWGLKEKYLVCEKSDGVRYMLLTCPNGACFLVDRNTEFYRLELNLKAFPGLLNTVLDGEWVLDRAPNGMEQKMFWVFDAVALHGHYVGDLTLKDRLRAFAGCFLDVWTHVVPPTQAPFVLKLKPMFAGGSARFVWQHVVPGLKHESDGLIFTKDEAVYKAGTTDTILKWKPEHLNSIDFGVKAIEAKGESGRMESRHVKMLASNRGVLEDYYVDGAPQYIFISEENQSEILKAFPNGGVVIAECRFDPHWNKIVPPPPQSRQPLWSDAQVLHGVGGWRFMRIRADKNLPNDIRTVEKVLRSINDPVTEEDLFKVVETRSVQ